MQKNCLLRRVFISLRRQAHLPLGKFRPLLGHSLQKQKLSQSLQAEERPEHPTCILQTTKLLVGAFGKQEAQQRTHTRYCTWRQAQQPDTSLAIVQVSSLSRLLFKGFKCLSGSSSIKSFLDLCLPEQSVGIFSLRGKFLITYISRQISSNLR